VERQHDSILELAARVLCNEASLTSAEPGAPGRVHGSVGERACHQVATLAKRRAVEPSCYRCQPCIAPVGSRRLQNVTQSENAACHQLTSQRRLQRVRNQRLQNSSEESF